MNDKTIEYELRYISEFVREFNDDPLLYDSINLYNSNYNGTISIGLKLNEVSLIYCAETFLDKTLISVEDKRRLCKEFRNKFYRRIFKNLPDGVFKTKIEIL